MWSVYDKYQMSELRIKKRSERDLCTKKAQKKIWASNGIQTHDLQDTSAMLYQLSYMKPRRKQVRCEFNLYPLYIELEVNTEVNKAPWVTDHNVLCSSS